MTKRDVLGVAIRIIGLWAVVIAIVPVPQLVLLRSEVHGIFGLSPQAGSRLFFGELAGLMLCLVTGGFLLSYAGRIAAVLMHEDAILPWPEWISQRSVLFSWAAGAFGLIMIGTYLPGVLTAIAGFVANWWQYRGVDVTFSGRSGELMRFLADIIGLAVGLVLLFGCRKIGGWLERDSPARTPQPEAGNE